jgi:HK97 family phage major capsid protein/HK97 family phage prohead protease
MVGDVIEKGAFAEASAPLPMLFSHDQTQPIGVWDSISEDDKGLTVKGRLLIDTVERAREVRSLIIEKAVTGLSIGFVTRKALPRRDGGRTITALDLHEVSPVPVPAHPGARITSTKTATAANPKDEVMLNEEGAAPDNAEVKSLLSTLEGRFTERLDKIEAKLNRPATSTGDDDEAGIERKAFTGFLRKGVERMQPDEVKALTVATDATAGYLAPEQFASEIIKLLVQYSPIRTYARVVTIGASEIKLPRRTSGTTGYWTGETDDRTGSQPAYEQLTLTPHELATFTDVSNALLEDNFYNLEGELASEFAESFGKAEGTAFVTGNGTGKPKGLLAATGIAEITTGVAADFPALNPADKIIDLFHALPQPHAQNAVWLMNRNTLATVRKWKDGQGRYLVIDPISQGAPATLLGRPIVEAIDMPDVAADAYPIIFGDLQGYRIIDRVNLSVLRDPYTLATKGQVRFHARKRVGADVTHPDRFVKLKVAI